MGMARVSPRAMNASNELVNSIDQMLGRMGVYDKKEALPSGTTDGSTPAEPKEPFRIQDYTEAAAQLARTAEQLTMLVDNIDQTLATATSDEVTAKVDAAVSGSREAVNYLFWRAVLLVAVSCLLVMATALLYRAIVRRQSKE